MKEKKNNLAGRMALLAAASGILAPSVLAAGWCPTVRDYNITCNYCAVELTCNVDNVSIWITGSNVTFDGRGYSITNSPEQGIRVGGAAATIKNVYISGAGVATGSTYGHGIHFVYPTTSPFTVSNVENVNITESRHIGIYNQSGSAVSIRRSTIYRNGSHGVYGAGNRYTDFYNSQSNTNTGTGMVTNVNSSYAYDNGFSGNTQYGQIATGVSGLILRRNNYTSNYRGLVLSNTKAPNLLNNSGGWNTVNDCFDVGSTNGSHSGNVWQLASGTNCTP